MGKNLRAGDIPASIKNEIKDAFVGPYNLAEEMGSFCGASGHKAFKDDVTVENLMYQLTLLMREQTVSRDLINKDKLSSKQSNALVTLYNYARTCPDVDMRKLEIYTQCLLNKKILAPDTLMPMHQDKIADIKSLESAVCKRKDSHFSRYAQEKYYDRSKADVREKTSSSKSWGIFNDSVMYNKAIKYLSNELGNTNTYTNMELHAIKKSLMNIIEDAINKGHNMEACELLKILGNSKLTQRLERVKFKNETQIIDLMTHYFDKIMWSYAKHTRNLVLPDNTIEYNLKYRKIPDAMPSNEIAKSDKTTEAMKFVDDVFNGEYGLLFARNEKLKRKLIERYNHYLRSSYRSKKERTNSEVVDTINWYLEDQEINFK